LVKLQINHEHLPFSGAPDLTDVAQYCFIPRTTPFGFYA
jgi:hypothetical protein